MKKGSRSDLRPMRAKSLDELEGVVAGHPQFPSTLVHNVYAVRRKAIGELTSGELRLAIGQGEGLRYLMPIALERLEEDPLLEASFFRGDLLGSVLAADSYWEDSSEIRRQLRQIVERALARLAGVESPDWWAAEAPGLDLDGPDEIDKRNLESRLRGALGKLP